MMIGTGGLKTLKNIIIYDDVLIPCSWLSFEFQPHSKTIGKPCISFVLCKISFCSLTYQFCALSRYDCHFWTGISCTFNPSVLKYRLENKNEVVLIKVRAKIERQITPPKDSRKIDAAPLVSMVCCILR
jgi:hypothetical protein